jgi:sugar fermentation stimulation protein A
MENDRAQPRALLRVENPLPCTVVHRLNRFVVEVSLGGRHLRAHINNTGRLEGYLEPGRPGFCFPFARPIKTEVRLFAIEEHGLGAIIDTQMQMRAFEAAFHDGLIPWLRGCRLKGRNPRLGGSVLDYLLECGGRPFFLEVKSAVLREDGAAMYPDCPTARGRRHVLELIRHVAEGGDGGIVFLAALPKVQAFKPCVEGDPEMATLLRRAERVGVTVRSCSMFFRPGDARVYLDQADLEVRLV